MSLYQNDNLSALDYVQQDYLRELQLEVLCQINMARVNERGESIEGRNVSGRFATTHGADRRGFSNVTKVLANKSRLLLD